MSVIIRLQNLPWSANALDIRGFFRGLSILDGGVNIVGGEMGDAFIAFSTDEDARQAMMMDGGKIKEVGVRLSLSSRAEMQKVIEVARQSTAAAFGPITAPAAAAPPAAAAAAVVVPPTITTAAVASPVIETPVVVTAAPTLTSPLSNLLTQQMLQQKIRQQEQENLQQQLEQQLLEHKKQLLQQQLTGKTLLVGDLAQQLTFQQLQQRMQIGQEQKPQSQALPSLMQNPLKDPRRGMDLPGEKLQERDRRGRDRRSRSRSRERRRSRSRDRGRRRDGRDGRDGREGRDGRDRRERSRSRERRDRDRDRRRRERGTRSRERSYERERNSKDRTRDDGKDPGKANAPVYTANTQIWDIPPNIPNTAQMLTVQPVLEPNTASQSSLSPEDRSNLMKLNEKRDMNAFQSGGWKGGRGYGNYRENEEDSENSCCVRVTGMDLTTGYGEIRRFFHGLSINMNGIKMINDKTGKRTGIAFIEFVRSDAQRSAVQRDGQSIRGRQVRVTAATKEEFDREVDSYRPPRGDRGRNFSSQEYPGMLERSTEYDNSAASRCLKVTNLPSHATQQDIIKMYSNYSLDEIVMVQENSRILTAYVRFFRMDDAKSALNLPAGLFVYRGLEVSVCDEDKFNNMLVYHGGGCPGRNVFPERRLDSSKDTSQENSQDYSQDNADSLPSADDKEDNANESMESDVLHVAEDEEPEQDHEDEQEEDVQEVYEINDDEVVPADVEVSMDVVSQESNDECPPVFKKQEDPRLLKTTLNESIQSTFNQSSLDPRLNRQPPPPLMEIRDPRLNPNPTGFKKTDCVVMSNLEPKITDRDVVDFFSDVGLIPLRVHILLNTMGQPSGDCFVEFTTMEDAEKALTKHRTHLGQNEVTVEAISREKVEEILNSFDEPSPAFEVDPPEEMQQQQQPMMPAMSQFQMRGGFGSGGGGMQQQQQQQQQQSSMMRMRGPYPPPRGPPMGPNGPMGYTPRPPFGMRMNGNGMMMNAGRVVNMENLPYRATYDDILEFFGDFKLTPADIMRRFNDKGQATGDARVRFMNPAEAMRAVDTRNQARIMGRPIYLTLLDN